MKITKYEHSCLVLEEQGKRLVIDPGKFSVSLPPELIGVVGIVITHVHSDHFDKNYIQQLLANNPGAKIYTVQDVADQMEPNTCVVVSAGQSENVGPFNLQFFGGQHELYQGFQNIAVLVNNALFHPGDSYTLPSATTQIEALAAPASAPWLRVSEASQFIKECHAKKVFPIHNSLLSEIGESIHYRILSEAAKETGSEWVALGSGDSLSV